MDSFAGRANTVRMQLAQLACGFLATQAVLSMGCSSVVRLTVAPTVDTGGAVGADVRVSVTPFVGPAGIEAGIGGSYIGSKGVGAAQLRLGPALYFQPDPVYVRFGLGYSGRFLGPLPDCGPLPTGSVAGWSGLMGHLGVEGKLHTIPRGGTSSISILLGPELTAEFLGAHSVCGLKNLGIFSLGLSLSALFNG